MRGMFVGARWRMVRWSMLVLGLIVLVISSVVYVSLQRTLMSTVDDELKSAAQSAQVELVEAGGTGDLAREGFLAGRMYVALGADGSVLTNPQSIDVRVLPTDLLTTASSSFATVEVDGDAVRLYAERITEPGGGTVTLVVGQSLAPERAAADQLLVTLAICVLIGMLLSFAGAWFLAARALVPIQHAFQRQQEFVADASHELRTPLSILHSAADLLVQDAGHGNAPLVFEIRDEIRRMERLTQQLLTLARSDRGELAMSLGRIELGSFARDLAARIRILTESRHISLKVESPTMPVFVEGDPDRLEQVGLILLDNALNHTPAGGTVIIRVTVAQAGGDAVLEVEDNGEGIPPEQFARVFDRFHRVDASRARGTGGAGLGLAIARTLVDAHGGQISIGSGPAGGTRVTVRLPRLDPAPQVAAHYTAAN